jgi:hypothetical protein
MPISYWAATTIREEDHLARRRAAFWHIFSSTSWIGMPARCGADGNFEWQGNAVEERERVKAEMYLVTGGAGFIGRTSSRRSSARASASAWSTT